MSDIKIDFLRFEKIIRGDIEPEDRAETLFLLAYTGGLAGDILSNIALSVKYTFDDFDKNELLYFMFGYMMGQKDFIETFDDYEEAKTKGRIQ